MISVTLLYRSFVNFKWFLHVASDIQIELTFFHSSVVYHPFRPFWILANEKCAVFVVALFSISIIHCAAPTFIFLLSRSLCHSIFSILTLSRVYSALCCALLLYSLSLLLSVHFWWLLISSFAQNEKFQMENVEAKIDWVNKREKKRGTATLSALSFCSDWMWTTESVKRK